MEKEDATYLAHITARIVRMFERYSQKINPNDSEFLSFIQNHLESKGFTNLQTVAYSTLYLQIKEGIREYLHNTGQEE